MHNQVVTCCCGLCCQIPTETAKQCNMSDASMICQAVTLRAGPLMPMTLLLIPCCNPQNNLTFQKRMTLRLTSFLDLGEGRFQSKNIHRFHTLISFTRKYLEHTCLYITRMVK